MDNDSSAMDHEDSSTIHNMQRDCESDETTVTTLTRKEWGSGRHKTTGVDGSGVITSNSKHQ